jgi:hypothetical protein
MSTGSAELPWPEHLPTQIPGAGIDEANGKLLIEVITPLAPDVALVLP